jgi:hypothetical protein
VMRPLLIALGVDLAVVAAAVIVFGCRRSLRRQPCEFAGVIRAPGGVVGSLKWRRGSGRWVRDVLAWSRARLIFRNELLPVDWLSREHPEPVGGVKRLGGRPVVIDCGTDPSSGSCQRARRERRVPNRGCYRGRERRETL